MGPLELPISSATSRTVVDARPLRRATASAASTIASRRRSAVIRGLLPASPADALAPHPPPLRTLAPLVGLGQARPGPASESAHRAHSRTLLRTCPTSG